MENLSQHWAKMQEQLNTLKLRCQTQQIMIRKLSREKQELIDSNILFKKDLLKIYDNLINENSFNDIMDDLMTIINTIETGESELKRGKKDD